MCSTSVYSSVERVFILQACGFQASSETVRPHLRTVPRVLHFNCTTSKRDLETTHIPKICNLHCTTLPRVSYIHLQHLMMDSVLWWESRAPQTLDRGVSNGIYSGEIRYIHCVLATQSPQRVQQICNRTC